MNPTSLNSLKSCLRKPGGMCACGLCVPVPAVMCMVHVGCLDRCSQSKTIKSPVLPFQAMAYRPHTPHTTGWRHPGSSMCRFCRQPDQRQASDALTSSPVMMCLAPAPSHPLAHSESFTPYQNILPWNPWNPEPALSSACVRRPGPPARHQRDGPSGVHPEGAQRRQPDVQRGAAADAA